MIRQTLKNKPLNQTEYKEIQEYRYNDVTTILPQVIFFLVISKEENVLRK
jgi:hypothetical protein